MTVTADVALVETETGSRGQVIDNQRINDLPSNGRNPLQFVGLATGVQFAGSSQTYFRPFDTQLDFTINGGQRGVNEIQIDGVPNNAITYYTAEPQFAYAPPSEATQEFKVQTNTYDAQYGRTSGGVINLSIKTGTNKVHGAAYEYLRRTGLTANTYANNANNTAASQPVTGSVRVRNRRPGVSAEAVPRPRPHVLHVRVREVSRRPAAAGPGIGAHAGTAQRRLLARPFRRTGSLTSFTIRSRSS